MWPKGFQINSIINGILETCANTDLTKCGAEGSVNSIMNELHDTCAKVELTKNKVWLRGFHLNSIINELPETCATIGLTCA